MSVDNLRGHLKNALVLAKEARALTSGQVMDAVQGRKYITPSKADSEEVEALALELGAVAGTIESNLRELSNIQRGVRIEVAA